MTGYSSTYDVFMKTQMQDIMSCSFAIDPSLLLLVPGIKLAKL